MNSSGASEVRVVLTAAGRLASPGDILFGTAHAALRTFGLLDYASARKAADLLANKLEPVLRGWESVIASLLRPQ